MTAPRDDAVLRRGVAHGGARKPVKTSDFVGAKGCCNREKLDYSRGTNPWQNRPVALLQVSGWRRQQVSERLFRWRFRYSRTLGLVVVGLVPVCPFVVVAGIEVCGVVRVLALGDPGHVARSRLFVVDKPVIRAALGLVAPVFVDARIDEDSREGQQDKGGNELSFHGDTPWQVGRARRGSGRHVQLSSEPSISPAAAGSGHRFQRCTKDRTA